jgi:hypothetical protein
MTVLALQPALGSAHAIDTLRGPARVASRFPMMDRAGRPMPEAVRRAVEPLFGSRPLVAGTSTWHAVFDPASNAIAVEFTESSSRLIVRWPNDAVAVTDSMRLEAGARFHEAGRIAYEGPDELWERSTLVERRRLVEGARSLLTFADSLASVAALFADGDCLWMVGVDPFDHLEGASQEAIAVNVRTHAVIGPIRLARRGTRLRDLAHGFAYSIGRAEKGEFFVERTPLPGCPTS